MAISNLDQLIAGARPVQAFYKFDTNLFSEAAGIPTSLFYAPGTPGAAVAPTPGLNGAALTSYAGQLPFVNPGSGNTYLTRFACAPTQNFTSVYLVDRLWHNSGISITTTTSQAITFPGLPARDVNGSTNGDKVYLAIEVSTVTGNAGVITNTTVSYTNQAGTAGRAGTVAAWPITAVAGTFVPVVLQAGDTGVRSVQSITLGTSYVSGVIHLVAYRIIAYMNLLSNNINQALTPLSGGLPQLYNDSVPFLLSEGLTSGVNPNYRVTISYSQG